MVSSDVMEMYKDLTENMRHYANMRFAQLTLYFALNAGLFTGVFATSQISSNRLKLALKLIGVLGGIAFGIMEERAADYWHHLRRRAEKVETLLPYKQFADRPAGRVFTATNAARVLIWGGALLWLMSVLCSA